MAEDRVVMTASDLEALQAEIAQLESEGRAEIAARIRTAREWGDLKENSEYHDAKNDQARLETKILVLRDRLSKAEVREASTSADVVGFGSRVELEDSGTGKALTYTLVSPVDADAREGRISFDSPIAKALTGARAGQTVTVSTPRGQRALRVLAIG